MQTHSFNMIERTHFGLKLTRRPDSEIPPHVLTTFRHACEVFAYLIERGERITPLDWCERIENRYAPHHRRARVTAAIKACMLDAPAVINEAGTPVYSVTVEESRRVTMSRTFTVLGGTPEAAKAEAEERAARGWQQLAELGGFSLGQVEGDAPPVPAALARRLLAWAEQMGGWDAPVWAELRAHFEGEAPAAPCGNAGCTGRLAPTDHDLISRCDTCGTEFA